MFIYVIYMLIYMYKLSIKIVSLLLKELALHFTLELHFTKNINNDLFKLTSYERFEKYDFMKIC
jgi:hypothetical protein